MILLVDLTLNEMKELFEENQIPKFRATQVFQWILKGVSSFQEMSNLPLSLKEKLDGLFLIGIPEILNVFESKNDETKKFVLKLSDGEIIESVLMKYHHGLSVCISSQAGCRMGCSFCASTGLGFSRNLTLGEMLAQILVMQREAGQRVSNVVVMGIGEPFDNYDNLISFLKLANHAEGLNIGYRHFTVSTCGLADKIIRLAYENLPINLSVSLHTTNDVQRNSIMPVNKSYNIDKLLHGCKIYIDKTKRRITLEYALIHNFNDSAEDADRLGNLLKGLLCLVNIIPVNEVKGREFKRTERLYVTKFAKLLEQNGLQVTIRRELGDDINAACGQLRRNEYENGDFK